MAGSSSFLTDLSHLIESLSVNDGGSSEQALSSILGVDLSGVEDAAGAFATKLGLGSKSSMVEMANFVLTKAAFREGAQLIGIKGDLAKLDQMAELQKQVGEMNLIPSMPLEQFAEMDVILSNPLELAVTDLGKALEHMESQNAEDTIKELERVKKTHWWLSSTQRASMSQ